MGSHKITICLLLELKMSKNCIIEIRKNRFKMLKIIMKQFVIIIYIIFLGVQNIMSQNEADIEYANKFIIHSNILNEDRTCLISLPDTYHDSSVIDKKYPIIVLLDGYAFFKTAAGIVHFMSSDRNRNHFMPETIIIAIKNVDRERDFTFTKLKTKRPNTMGGGRFFLNFIEKELIPYLDKNYRTEARRTLVGHSLGGQFALNAYMDKNSIFNAYISIDPSLWWDEVTMNNKVNTINPICFKKKLYIATASQQERRYEKNKKRHDLFFELMKIKSNEQISAKIQSFNKENHLSVSLIALYEGLKYLN